MGTLNIYPMKGPAKAVPSMSQKMEILVQKQDQLEGLNLGNVCGFSSRSQNLWQELAKDNE